MPSSATSTKLSMKGASSNRYSREGSPWPIRQLVGSRSRVPAPRRPSTRPAQLTPTPAYSGTFIPVLWSTKLIEKFYASTVLAAISNTDYEGEIKNKGDTVVIRTKPTITIKDYQADGLLEVERPASNIIELKIDKGKYFNLILDDVFEVQSRPQHDEHVVRRRRPAVQDRRRPRSPEGLLGQADARQQGHHGRRHLRATSTSASPARRSQIVARNPAGTAGKVEIVDLLVRLGQALDEQNIPETGRWVVVPAWISSQIKMSELRDASLTGDGVSILRNGRLGMVDRFTIYVSNLLPSGTAAGLAAGEMGDLRGHAARADVRLADQQGRDDALRADVRQLLRGLQVYGCKVLDGKALAQAIVTPAEAVDAVHRLLTEETCQLWNLGQYLDRVATPAAGRDHALSLSRRRPGRRAEHRPDGGPAAARRPFSAAVRHAVGRTAGTIDTGHADDDRPDVPVGTDLLHGRPHAAA